MTIEGDGSLVRDVRVRVEDDVNLEAWARDAGKTSLLSTQAGAVENFRPPATIVDGFLAD